MKVILVIMSMSICGAYETEEVRKYETMEECRQDIEALQKVQVDTNLIKKRVLCLKSN